MRQKLKIVRGACVAAAVVALGVLVAAPGALAAHKGEYAEFNYCPSTNPEVNGCLYSVTNSGEVVLGNKKVPIVNPVVLQGGVGAANETTGEQRFFAATNGVTLSKAAQPVPGGLSGLVNCKELTGLLRITCEGLFENGLTGVNSTLELARPASEIKINEGNILFRRRVGLVLPVKVHLENPLLGSSCYVGSSSSPLLWNLTTGTTSPPAPNKPISGSTGKVEYKGEDEGILRLNGATFVDNAWSAPAANGCGGFLVEYLLDPIIDSSVGVPAAAGKNTAILKGISDTAEAAVVNEH